MGADIHGWVEICRWPYEDRDDVDPQWIPGVHIDNLAKRNYRIFGYLFGVRGRPYNAQFADRGLPDSVTDRVEADYEDWLPDAHSPSYCTFAELYPAWKQYCETQVEPEREPSPHWQTLISVMDDFATQYRSEYVRLTVWFDS